MKRAPLGHPPAAQVMQELPTLRPLTFAPFDYATHPIDTYDGPQGWGPFNGPWTPWDWHDPAAQISDGYDGSNEWQFAPPADILTLFGDNSLDYVWNTSYDMEAQRNAQESQRAYTSTAANAIAPRGPSLLSRLRDALSGSGE